MKHRREVLVSLLSPWGNQSLQVPHQGEAGAGVQRPHPTGKSHPRRTAKRQTTLRGSLLQLVSEAAPLMVLEESVIKASVRHLLEIFLKGVFIKRRIQSRSEEGKTMSASGSLDSRPCSRGCCGLQKRPRTAWTAMNSASLRGLLGAVPLGLPSQPAGLRSCLPLVPQSVLSLKDVPSWHWCHFASSFGRWKRNQAANTSALRCGRTLWGHFWNWSVPSHLLFFSLPHFPSFH